MLSTRNARFAVLLLSASVCVCVLYCFLQGWSTVPNQRAEKHNHESTEQNEFFIPKRCKDVNVISKLEKRLPQVLFIGVKKCGTDAFKQFTAKHPKVKLTLAQNDHFFRWPGKRGVKFYMSVLPYTMKDEVTMGLGPAYLSGKHVPRKIQQFYGTEEAKRLKFIVLLCDPIKRLYSDYVHELTSNHSSFEGVKQYKNASALIKAAISNVTKMNPGLIENPILDRPYPKLYEYIDKHMEISLLTNGMYALHLTNWLSYYSVDQFLFLSGEKLIKKPWEVMREVQEFLGVDQAIVKDNFKYSEAKGFFCFGKCMGKTKGLTRSGNDKNSLAYPEMTVQDREILKSFYSPFTFPLSMMIKKAFEWQ